MKISTWFFLITLFLFCFLIYSHEIVHVIIFKNYGSDSKIVFTKLGIQTIADDPSKCDSYCMLAHHLNEAITYPLIPIYWIIALGIYFMICAREESDDSFKYFARKLFSKIDEDYEKDEFLSDLQRRLE